jgi:hypothetical protein
MPVRGERALTRYIRHPAASTSNPLSNGWALDAGSAILTLDNNAHHLAEVATRPLVQTNGQGAVQTFTSYPSVFQGVLGLEQVDPTQLNFAQQNPWAAIPWDRNTATRFGACHFIADHELASGATTIRPVKTQMRVTIDTNVTTKKAFAAITFTQSPPFLTAPFLFGSYTFPGTGAQTAEITLTSAAPVSRTSTVAPLRCRPDATYGSTRVEVIQGYLWFGWLLYGATASTSYVESYSAWEVWS